MEDLVDYNIQFSASSPILFPTEIHLGIVEFPDGTFRDIPKRFPIQGEWGEIISNQIRLHEKSAMPVNLFLIWLSITEQKFYKLSLNFPSKAMELLWSYDKTADGESLFSHIVIGMAPLGNVAIWFRGYIKSCIIALAKGSLCKVEMDEFLPNNPNMSISDYCNYYLKNGVLERNISYGRPVSFMFDKCMQQFTYRYRIIFSDFNFDEKKWVNIDNEEEKPAMRCIENVLYDGTHDKLHDGGLMNYHQAGKPKKIAIKWHIKKSEYTAYFWFEDEEIRAVFDRFYGAHPDTKTDFMIRIDSEKKKFELALYRYGLKEPQVISESAYQLLVFKNKFEYFRSENYNQPRGAWIW